MFWNGVRLPFSLFTQSFLVFANVAPAQPTPNPWGVSMALAILWPKLGEGEEITLPLLSTITLMKFIKGFSGFCSLNSHRGTLFNALISYKNWKDHRFLVGGRWLVGDDPMAGRVCSYFREHGRYLKVFLFPSTGMT